MKMKRVNRIRRCRLCGCEDNLNNFLNIFDDKPELELEKKISKLLPIVVMAWDPLPHIVCDACIDKLNTYNDFFENTLKTERFLRTQVPSAPENLESPNPVVQLMATPGNSGEERTSSPRKEVEKQPEDRPKRTLNCFIISPITSRESVYTCRQCYRTFTKESSALTHSCVRIERCGELETVRRTRKKSLPPLKIRLFCVKSGQFVCYLCRTPFEDKTELVNHIKGHFLDGDWDDEEGKGCSKQKGKRKGRCASECEGDVEQRAERRKRKRFSGSTKKKRPAGVESKQGMCEKCKDDHNCPTSSGKETPESPMQDSELYNSEPETGVQHDNQSIPLITLEDSEDDSEEVTVLEETDSIFPRTKCCAFCDKSPSSEDSLVDLEGENLEGYGEINGDAAFLCSFCAATFACKKSLRAHEWAHDAERFGDLSPKPVR